VAYRLSWRVAAWSLGFLLALSPPLVLVAIGRWHMPDGPGPPLAALPVVLFLFVLIFVGGLGFFARALVARRGEPDAAAAD